MVPEKKSWGGRKKNETNARGTQKVVSSWRAAKGTPGRKLKETKRNRDTIKGDRFTDPLYQQLMGETRKSPAKG